jgi:aerobic-type carbon monoxide dehydrogenase small subunit (CoxS/CutS family)
LRVNITVNGDRKLWDVPVHATLLDMLRSHGYWGAKRVCESGECGACAVKLNGLAVDSCIMLAAQAGGGEIVTVEGLERDGRLHAVQETFADNGSIQCGFCIPGMVVTASHLLDENPHPTEDEVRHVFVGNLCRCTGYKKPIEAVLQAAAIRDSQ